MTIHDLDEGPICYVGSEYADTLAEWFAEAYETPTEREEREAVEAALDDDADAYFERLNDDE